jgi:hypothetical protein
VLLTTAGCDQERRLHRGGALAGAGWHRLATTVGHAFLILTALALVAIAKVESEH